MLDITKTHGPRLRSALGPRWGPPLGSPPVPGRPALGHDGADAHGRHHGRRVLGACGSAAARVDEALHHCTGAADA